MSVLQKLTEGIVNRDLQKEGHALLKKWERTGLLEGIDNEQGRQCMARLLENQAKELLREASTMAGGDVEGFAAVAFPIVRRVFGGLIANDLVSVQPMSLPSGLIFFMDFEYSKTDTDAGRFGKGTTFESSFPDSIYGGDRVGSQITGGVQLEGQNPDGTQRQPGSFYNLGGTYSSPTGSAAVNTNAITVASNLSADARHGSGRAVIFLTSSITDAEKKLLNYDADLLSLASEKSFDATNKNSDHLALVFSVSASAFPQLNRDNLTAIGATGTQLGNSNYFSTSARVVRRLTRLHPNSNDLLLVTVVGPSGSVGTDGTAGNVIPVAIESGLSMSGAVTFTYPKADSFTTSNAIGSVVGQNSWGLEEAADSSPAQTDSRDADRIPEIDIKVDSVAVTAITKKLKAKWTPELGQDLNAYHNLDAEVELTSILSEHIALEIDQEILSDLVKGAKAATYYWSRRPGKFVNRETGTSVEDWSSSGIDSAANLLGADFTGTVSEWYETLVETINDVSAQIHRKTLRGGANFLVTSPEVANILEFTSGFRANITHDEDKGTVGAVKAGQVSKKWDVWVDPYFPRNLVLVGRKGGSFLESGYVYAPYVPLQVTPTIFGVEDFVPRKGVMTRYAKKMVRPDMYGLVVVADLLG